MSSLKPILCISGSTLKFTQSVLKKNRGNGMKMMAKVCLLIEFEFSEYV